MCEYGSLDTSLTIFEVAQALRRAAKRTLSARFCENPRMRHKEHLCGGENEKRRRGSLWCSDYVEPHFGANPGREGKQLLKGRERDRLKALHTTKPPLWVTCSRETLLRETSTHNTFLFFLQAFASSHRAFDCAPHAFSFVEHTSAFSRLDAL